MTLDQAIERLYDLHTGVTPVEESAPHEQTAPFFQINIHQSVILPKDPAIHPEKDGLEWRRIRLSA